MHGRWVEREDAVGIVWEWSYVEGTRQRRSITRYRDGNVEDGSYVGGDWARNWTTYREQERSEYTDSKTIRANDAVDQLRPEMVLIPAGRFRMGRVSGVGCNDRAQPVYQVAMRRSHCRSTR